MSDFIMTIEDDTEVIPEIHEKDEAEQNQIQQSDNNTKKIKVSKNKYNTKKDIIDPDFTFYIDKTSSFEIENGYDFTDEIKIKSIPSKTIDDIIAKKRDVTKKINGQNGFVKGQSENIIDEHLCTYDDNGADNVSNNYSSKNEDEIRFMDDDEDIDAGGFGTGVNDTGVNDTDDELCDSEQEQDDIIDESNVDEYQYQDDINNSSSEEESEYNKQRKKEYFADESEIIQDHTADSFQNMNLSRPILKGLSQLGFIEPTPIQRQTIPVALMGKDICGGAITGSGKTAAFLVPVMERLLYRPRQASSIRVLVLTPTRELAIQCYSVANKLAAFSDITICLCSGGLNLKKQEIELRKRPDVVIATPGRLIDHLRNSPSFTMDTIEILIIDEADRMLEDGFANELNEIIKYCPKSRQTMLFSATMTENIDDLIRLSLNRPVRLMVDPAKATATSLTQEFIRVREHREKDRPAMLIALCMQTFRRRIIIFFRTKATVHEMKIVFGLLGLKAAELHGNLSQEQRLEALEAFRGGKVDFLLATNLASRGLDIRGIETVINYDMPQSYDHYIHRVGRTARAGCKGRSVTLIGKTDRKLFKMVIKHASKNQIKKRTIDPATVKEYRELLNKLNDQVKEVVEEEKEEKAMQQIETEIQKSQNLLIHESEIYSRPARTWFQPKQQKRRSNNISKQSFEAPKSTKVRKRCKLNPVISDP